MAKLRLSSVAGFLAVLAMLGVAIAQTASSGGSNRQEPPAWTAPGHRVRMPDQLTWGAPPLGLPPGAQVAVVDGDPARAVFYVVRVRAPNGYKIGPHWHSQDEHITVLSGRMEMGFGDQMGANMAPGGPGAYFGIQGGHRHSATMRGETVVQIDGHGPFDISYVNPSDDPRTQHPAR
jgi:hypothetical protein